MKPSEEFKTLLEVLPSNLQAKCNVFLDSVTGINSDLSLYVKTIYIGVELDGAMVAALYPLKDSLEVVLALDSSHENSKLKDATHLTWRTMPVLFKVEKVSDFKSLNSFMFYFVSIISI